MEQKVKALFSAAAEGRAQAERLAEQYRTAGWQIHLHHTEDLEESRRWAEERLMTHLLYFHDEEQVTLVSFSDEMGGYSVEIKVSDLILPDREK